jgi:transcriptional regulator with PAS, ATPase and Fis domain
MLKHIKINHNWMLHTITETAEPIFSPAQFELINEFINEETLHLLKNIIQQQLYSLQENGVVQLKVFPFEFLIVKRRKKTMIALSKAEEVTPYSSTEREISKLNTPFIAHSAKMRQMIEIIKKVSYVDSTILLLGKSGVGKSMIAKIIHKYSSRSDKNFISVNCGAIPEPLMEAELFGYTSGSFTGGQRGGKKGIFESANEGTVFLDEIGELPLNLQVKLLEVLQENSIRPIGGTKLIPINVRVIAATNQNLLELVQQKKFREDLYYRLNVVPIEIPPLKERKEDIIYLARHFLQTQINKYGIFKTLHPDVEEAFVRYEWPGNARELENMIERLFITTEEKEIQLTHLPPFFHSFIKKNEKEHEKNTIMPLKEAKKMLEKELIIKAYDRYQSTYKAAEALGVDQSTIAKKLKSFREEGE